MREVVVRGAGAPGQVTAQQVAIGPHTLLADEPIGKGGLDTGPAPHELLLAALGTCTAMTVRLYAARKGWAVRDVRVALNAETVEGRFAITKRVTLAGDLDAAQRARLLEIADKCPVHRTLIGEVVISTSEVIS